MAVDVPEMVTMFIESHDDQDMVSKLRSLSKFTRGIVILGLGCDLCYDHTPNILV
jgi:hypothetical protein